MSLQDLIQKTIQDDPVIGPKLKLLEEIERDVDGCVDFVDLKIAFSPVLLKPATSTLNAVEIDYKAQGEKYVIRNPYKVLTEDQVKRARARFLVVQMKERRAK